MDEPTVVTSPEAFRRVVARSPDDSTLRVPVELRIAVDDPFDAYRRARDGPGGVFLETSGGQTGWGYFSVDPVQRLQARPGAVALGGESVGPTLAAVDGLIGGETLARGDCVVPYPCGVFGWLSYDIARELEDLPASAVDDRGLPTLQVGVYDVLAAWRCPAPADDVELHVTACPRVEDDPAAAYDRGLERARGLVAAIGRGSGAVGPSAAEADRARFESEVGAAGFAERVRRAKAYIRDGETFQANLSHRLAAPAAVHPVEAFDALRRVNPAPYSGLLEFPGLDLVGASPELLLDVGDDRILTEPIAGTRPRGDTDAADRLLEADLLDDEKERAEHAMLVDLERNDLGKVCVADSVEVTEYRRVDRYAEVMHLVSRVDGQLREGVRVVDAIAAAFPGGTITGVPKPRTMTIIDELEATRRGPYTGSVLALGFDGRATLNIVIRTLERVGDEYHLRVGAGIVHDSVPEREYEETLDKARALVTAVEEALDRPVSFAVGGES